MKAPVLILSTLLLASAIPGYVYAGTTEQAKADPSAAVSAMTLNFFMQNYYLHPTDISLNLAFLDQSGLAAKVSLQPTLAMFYSCIFAAGDEIQRAKWFAQINQLSSPTKSLLVYAIAHQPDNIMAAAPISPGRNDLDWSGFFATGDLRYVDDVIARLNGLDERKDLQRYVTAGSAAWSLAMNAKMHPLVHARLEALKASNGPLTSIADELLNKPEQLQ